MSSSSSYSLLLVFSVLSLLFSLLTTQSHSLPCTPQSSTLNNRTYTNCTDLQVLNATLHYTYNAANSSLSIAYIAKPADSGAWIAWAINPTATGMIGSQALMALKTSTGSIVAKTYNISGYHSVVESKLSFDFWDLAADEANGTMRLFAVVKVPENAESVNQVWQIGGAVNGSTPRIHPLATENRQSKGVLKLTASASSSPTTAPGPTNGTATVPAAPPPSSSVRNGGRLGLVLSILAAVVVVGLF